MKLSLTEYALFIHLGEKYLNNNETSQSMIRQLKREYRMALKAQNYEFEEAERVINDEIDNIITKRTVYHVMTETEIRDYKDLHTIAYRQGQYDCTGQIFTVDIQVFPLPQSGKTVIYHFMARDV